MLCSECQLISQKEEFNDVSKELTEYKHYQWTKLVREAARGGCSLCAIICGLFDIDEFHKPVENLQSGYYIHSIKKVNFDTPFSPSEEYYLQWFCKSVTRSIIMETISLFKEEGS